MLPTVTNAQPRRDVAFHSVSRAAVHGYAPIAYPDGSYRFPYGEAIPDVRVGVGDECDIQLQSGEKINQAIISDSARWKATDGVSGADTPHMFVKPTQDGLWATLTITTTRRVYHLRLESADGRQNEYVGFYYPQEAAARAAADKRRAVERSQLAFAASVKRAAAQRVLADTYVCANLDARYKVAGANEFRPVSVCNDGAHTYVNVREIVGDLPQPYALDNNTDEIVNYSYDRTHRQFVLDGVPTNLALIRGSGRGQLRTTFARALR
ncbi:MAG: TrbG/VirB9 family P-type conjugative transfer protein [Candidatus Eremiobacteraeota bacterium]|nr:TrbG/VirB9 family P-type conjugative transfer protein [Candidatus Eremiobacteraeota bacterium]